MRGFVSVGGLLALGWASIGSGCSGGEGGSPPGGPNGGGLPGNGDSHGVNTSSPLLGTWDVVAAGERRDWSGVLTIGVNSLKAEWGDFSLNIEVGDAVPKIQTSYDEGKSSVVATHEREPLDFGQIPLALGGTWNLRGRGADQCVGKAGPGTISIDCSNLGAPVRGLLQGYDHSAKRHLSTGLSTAQRTSKLDSIFGDLGGEWTVVLPRVRCDVTISGNKLTAKCSDSTTGRAREGTLSLTFDEGMASGESNVGEVSARRR